MIIIAHFAKEWRRNNATLNRAWRLMEMLRLAINTLLKYIARQFSSATDSHLWRRVDGLYRAMNIDFYHRRGQMSVAYLFLYVDNQ